MRNLTLSLIALGACFLVFTNVQAQAGMIYCDFDGVGNGDISSYMTGMMGSKVTVEHAELRANEVWYDPPWWVGKEHDDYYIRTDESRYLEINFCTPITKVKGDGYVFIPGLDRKDFVVVGYDGETEINKFQKNTGFCEPVPFELCFATPVNRLVISDNFQEFVGVDNLCVQPVPVPGAGLLSALGIGITGWLKRRKTL